MHDKDPRFGLVDRCYRLAGAHAYPTNPIRLIVPTAAGNATSNVARFIGQKFTESWGQQVIVDNRAGGNSVEEIALDNVSLCHLGLILPKPDAWPSIMTALALICEQRLLGKLYWHLVR